jgi:hypothetical protein
MIKLGSKVRDNITGFEGIAHYRVTTFSGLIRYCVQPKSDDPTKIVDAMELDHHSLEVLNEDMCDKVTPCKFIVDIPLGSTVQDIASGFTGVAESYTEHFNGCITYCVRPRIRESDLIGGRPDTSSIVQESLVLVKTEGAALPVKKPSLKTSGGPMTKVVREKVRK